MGRIPFVLAMLLLLAVGVAGADTAADYQRGLELLKQKRYEQAVSVFEGIASADLAYAARSHLQVGRCFRLMGQASVAVERFGKAIELATARAEQATLVEIKADLGDIHLCAKRFDDALRLCQDPGVLSLERGKHLLALIHMEKDDFANALPALDNLLAAFPNSPRDVEYRLVRAECLAFMQRFDELHAHLQKLMQDHPEARLTSGKAAKVLSSVIDVVAASGSKENASRLSDVLLPKMTAGAGAATARLRFSVIVLLKNAGRAEDAAKFLRAAKLATTSPEESANCLMQLGWLHTDAKSYPEAAAVYEEAEGVSSASAEQKARARHEAGYCYRLAGQNEAAEACMQAVVKNYPGTLAAREAQIRLSLWAKGK